MPLRAGFMPLATRFLSRVFCSATGITYKIIFLPFRILFKATAFKGRKKHTKTCGSQLDLRSYATRCILIILDFPIWFKGNFTQKTCYSL